MRTTLLFLFTICLSLRLSATTFIVTSVSNQGAGTLREAISNADNGDIIRFNPSLISSGSKTIELSSEITIEKDLTIIGLYNGQDTLFVSGRNQNRIFIVDLTSSPTGTMTIDSMALIKGRGLDYGGAIYCDGDHFNIRNCLFRDNYAKEL